MTFLQINTIYSGIFTYTTITILAIIKINKIDDTLADFLCVMFYKDEKGKRKKLNMVDWLNDQQEEQLVKHHKYFQ
jgi:hypothetical protein